MAASEWLKRGWLLLAACVVLPAQTEKAQIHGVVLDPTGAAIPSAELRVSNVNTGVKRTVSTTETGVYAVPLLDPGNYEVLARAEGFRQMSRTGIQLHVGQNARIDFEMKVGAITESIEVSAVASLLNTANADMGQLVDNRLVTSLPLLDRSPMQLTYLTPGLTPTNGGGNVGGFDPHTGTNFVANGARNSSSAVLLDGLNVTGVRGHEGLTWLEYSPSVDAVQEFKVQTNTFSAEYGRTGTSLINMVTKSGTNQFHGTAYTFHRNSALNANSFFSNRAGQSLPEFKRRLFGGVIGGPILRNRTFFFSSFEQARAEQVDARFAIVPTARERVGDFSQTLAPNRQSVSIYDPFSLAAGTNLRQPFPGNVIPASRLNPIATKVLANYPQPNLPPGASTQNYFGQGIYAKPVHQVDAKIDHHFSEKQRLSGRFSVYWWTEEVPDYFGGAAQPFYNGTRSDRNPNGALEYSRIQSPTTILSVRYGVLRRRWNHRPLSLGFDPTSLGLPSLYRESGIGLFPSFSSESYTPIGTRGSSLIARGDHTHSLVGSVTTTRSGHTLKIGAEARYLFFNDFQPGFPAGGFNFRQRETGQNPLRVNTSQGNAIASMLVGWPGGGRYDLIARGASASRYYGAYLQDDWRVTRKLTMNIGLRYDAELPRTDRYNRYNWFDLEAPSPIAGRVSAFPDLKGQYRFTDENNRGSFDGDYNNVQPRIGIAYSFDEKTTIRAGYGIYYQMSIAGAAGGPLSAAFSTASPILSSLDGGVTPYATLSNPYPAGLTLPPGRSDGESSFLGLGVGPTRENVTPQYQSWNFSIQREVPGKGVVEANYTGSKGTHLYFGGGVENLNRLDPIYWGIGRADLNRLVPNPFFGVITEQTSALSQRTVALNRLLRPFPQYTSVGRSAQAIANSIYHAAQFRYEKRFSAGLNVLAHYTISKLIDDSSSYGATFLNVSTSVQDYKNLRLERSLSTNDIPQRLVVAFGYELPFGRNRSFGRDMSRLADAFLGNWELTGMFTFQSGFPIIPGLQGSVLWEGTQRPNLVGDPATYGPVVDRLNRYFNVNAFARPEPDTYGTAPRTLNYRTPGLRNADLALLKRVRFTEQKRLEFRLEAFNATNTPTFGTPASAFGSSNFGIITGYAQGRGPRELQFGAKFYF